MAGFGFGHEPFGNFPFGRSNFGANTIVRSFPKEYVENEDGTVNERLLHYLQTIEESINTVKNEVDLLPDQVDFNKVRSDLLRYLGSTIAVTIDDYEPDEFKRSLVGNAVRLYRIKGTEDSYRIRGKISGYDVDVFNIFRINEELLLRVVTDMSLGFGAGGATQEFTGTLKTYPILPTSVIVKADGVPVAQDDGAGGWTALGAYGVSGTIDYANGAYSLTLTPGVPTGGGEVTVDFETTIVDEVVGTSNGVQSSYSHLLAFYPPALGSLRIHVNGVLVGEDDGTGAIVTSSGSPYTVTGTIRRLNGYADFEFLGPVPLAGDVITVSYDKTLLAEMLKLYPEDIYEIPSGSGYWFSVVVPGVIPGAPQTSTCDYCFTSYIKVRLTLVKPSTGSSPASENFFDRLVRKIREIVPIHVRDLIYELVLVILVNEHDNMGVETLHEESSWIPFGGFHRYDMVPADVIATDLHGYVRGTVELV